MLIYNAWMLLMIEGVFQELVGFVGDSCWVHGSKLWEVKISLLLYVLGR